MRNRSLPPAPMQPKASETEVTAFIADFQKARVTPGGEIDRAAALHIYESYPIETIKRIARRVLGDMLKPASTRGGPPPAGVPAGAPSPPPTPPPKPGRPARKSKKRSQQS